MCQDRKEIGQLKYVRHVNTEGLSSLARGRSAHEAGSLFYLYNSYLALAGTSAKHKADKVEDLVQRMMDRVIARRMVIK